MPANYAHHRFGKQILKAFPPEQRQCVQRFRRLFDVGLHGPDIFFHYNPYWKTAVGDMGKQVHAMTGAAVFPAACKAATTEASRAYLYGLLAHYCLDSVCHPLICGVSADGSVGHTELETEFDRYLLTKDGKVPAHRQNLGRNMHLTWGECVTISGFFPPATAYTVRQGVGIMSLVCRALTMKNRKLLQAMFRLGGEYASQLVMFTRPNHRCAQLIEPLEQLYDRALGRYAGLAAQLLDCLENGTPLGSDFDADFG